MKCPACGSKAIGKIGVDQFYCWDCCVVYKQDPNSVEMYEVDEDGTLLALDNREI